MGRNVEQELSSVVGCAITIVMMLSLAASIAIPIRFITEPLPFLAMVQTATQTQMLNTTRVLAGALIFFVLVTALVLGVLGIVAKLFPKLLAPVDRRNGDDEGVSGVSMEEAIRATVDPRGKEADEAAQAERDGTSQGGIGW